ncbi:membrane-bound PQQ-dependent dehydrogenase, glucose/quinate/shikimate family [Ramlibacter sp. AN1133]
MQPRSARATLLPRALAIVVAVVAACLVTGGVWLAGLGGSWYYLGAGMALLATAWLLWRRRAGAVLLFAAVFMASVAWAVWESGLDWWPLAARLDVLFVLGLVLLLPGMDGGAAAGARASRVVLGVALAAFALLAAASWLRDPHDVDGTLASNTAVTAPGGMAAADWTAYGGSGFGQRYSALRQITPDNVRQLQPVWHFNTGDVRGRPGDPKETTFEVTPLKVGNRLFFCTPHQNVIALDATTGAQVWRYDPRIQDKLALQHLTCRGLSWQAAASAPAASAPAGAAPAGAPAAGSLPIAALDGPTDARCSSRLFLPTADGRLIALNPDNGHVCAEFGGGTGQIDLWAGMPNRQPGAYYSTSPVVVARGLLVVGGTVLDNVSTHEQSGVIRAFDADSGRLVWNWDSGNPTQTAPLPAGQTYVANSPNSWSISAVDEALGLVYVPLGNQPPDQWGGNRSPAVEKYSSSIVALDLQTGQVRWSFQTVHHDLWDYDVPSQPSLLDLRVGSSTIPVLVQPTKQGELFVLDRRNGQPVVPVTEQRAPQGAADGDHAAPTQPRSGVSFDPPPLAGRDMWGATMFDQLYCRIAFHRLRYEGRFTPPSLQGSLVYPGNFGVFNWGSIAVDPVRGWAFTTPTYLAFVSQLVPRPDETALVVQGDGRPQGSLPALNENFGAPYAAKLYPFTSPLGIPCQQPPWGYVAGVDLANGHIVWRHRNGTVRDLAPVPLPFRMGVPSLGGPLITAAGVAFLSGTLDYYLRAYDVSTGHELWRSRLPAGGQATPMTYEAADGRQFLVVVAGGHGSLGTRAGDDVIAYALPR